MDSLTNMSFTKIQLTKARRELEALPEVFDTYPAKSKSKGEFIIVQFKKSNSLKNFYNYGEVKNFVELSK